MSRRRSAMLAQVALGIVVGTAIVLTAASAIKYTEFPMIALRTE